MTQQTATCGYSAWACEQVRETCAVHTAGVRSMRRTARLSAAALLRTGMSDQPPMTARTVEGTFPVDTLPFD